MKLKQNVLHQLLTGATAGDAITEQALMIRDWLRRLGFESSIYAQHIHPSMRQEIQPFATFRPSHKNPILIYHHSIGSEVADFLLKQKLPLILIYHNVTPATFFEHIDPAWVQMSEQGIQQLKELCGQTCLALADSAYNLLDLQNLGYEEKDVLPIAFREEVLDLPSNETLVDELREKHPLILFVGRLSPNKRQEDLVKFLYYYRRIQPTAHLYLVGNRWDVKYDLWIEDLAKHLDLEDAVTLTGKVSAQDLVTFYRTADIYISMSEHEGFGKPFIESMYCGLPILAYASTSIPYTLGDVGVQFHDKDYERLAELVDILLGKESLRHRLIANQYERATEFSEKSVFEVFQNKLVALGLG